MKEKKIRQGIHTRYGAGYTVWETEVESSHRGGVTVVWREEAGLQVEVVANFGQNMVSFLLTAGSRRWYFFGEYMPPNDAPMVYCMDQALEAAPRGVEVIHLGDVNVRKKEPRGTQ